MTPRSLLALAPLLLLAACAGGPDADGASDPGRNDGGSDRNYVVMIEGRNFVFDDKGRPTRFGFSASRNIRAGSAAQAERIAVRNVYDDETLNDSLLNSAEDPPRVTVTHVYEVESFTAGSDRDLGYIFYRDRDSK